MNITDEVYYYVETEALFSDPGSLGVRKLGTVASWTATLHRSQKEIACSFRVLLPCPGVQQVLFFDHRAFWMRTHMHACNPDIFLCARTHVWTQTHTHTHTHTHAHAHAHAHSHSHASMLMYTFLQCDVGKSFGLMFVKLVGILVPVLVCTRDIKIEL